MAGANGLKSLQPSELVIANKLFAQRGQKYKISLAPILNLVPILKNLSEGFNTVAPGSTQSNENDIDYDSADDPDKIVESEYSDSESHGQQS